MVEHTRHRKLPSHVPDRSKGALHRARDLRSAVPAAVTHLDLGDLPALLTRSDQLFAIVSWITLARDAEPGTSGTRTGLVLGAVLVEVAITCSAAAWLGSRARRPAAVAGRAG